MPTLPLTIKIKDYKYSANITVPAVPVCTPPKILNPFTGKCEECTPPKVYNYITGKCEAPGIVVCTPPQILNPFTGKCEECTPPKVYNYITGKCETPIIKPPSCAQFAPPICLDGTLIPQPPDSAGCPTPPKCQPKPSAETRIVKILPEDEKRLPDANSGETVKITATIICKTADIISRPRDTAYLIIDGAIADRKTIENGIVTFDWEATAVPISIHNICVKVDPSTNCKSPGQDCKRITVSLTILSIAEQLAKERASSAEQRKLLEQARSRLREEIIGAELQVPGYEKPAPYIPPTYEIPSTITTPPPIVTPPVSQPEYGDISIVGLPALILPITPEIPNYIYIDDKSVGRLYELPKTVTVLTGTHSIYSRTGDITTPTKTVFVTKDKTTTVTL